MNTNTKELNMNELEQVNGGGDWNLWDYIMIRFIHDNYVYKNEKKPETDSIGNHWSCFYSGIDF